MKKKEIENIYLFYTYNINGKCDKYVVIWW